jgi:hypothetical protein
MSDSSVPLPPVDVQSFQKIAGHASPAAAFSAASQFNARSRAPAFTRILAGRTLVDASWNEQAWLLEFTGGAWLLIVAANDGIQWNVLHEKPDWPTGQVALRPRRWENGAIARPTLTQWIDHRRGRECVRLSALPGQFLLYFPKCEILWLAAVKSKNSGEALIHAFVGH